MRQKFKLGFWAPLALNRHRCLRTESALAKLRLHRKMPWVRDIYTRLDEARRERDESAAEIRRLATELDDTRRDRDSFLAERDRLKSVISRPVRTDPDNPSLPFTPTVETQSLNDAVDDVKIVERTAGYHFLDDLPPEFEPEVYRSMYPDLQALSFEELADHYRACGRNEGRQANRLCDRNQFAATIPATAEALEIGPFTSPLVRGRNVRYLDILTREKVAARAQMFGLDTASIPEVIHYVGADLSIVDRRFDVVVSSHCLEHQPDLIRHLQDVAGLLNPGGAYFLLVPDKRYCFDHFIPLSNAAEVVAAHHERRQRHTLRSIIEHCALTTHNDSLRHWQGDHGPMSDGFAWRKEAALRQYSDANGAYVDVHAWYFTPDSAAAMLSTLAGAGLCSLKMLRLYPTRYGANEFWMVLQKPR